MEVVLLTALLLGISGLVTGIVLGIAGKLCASDEDEALYEKIRLIEKQLPGYNCGACGYPGCAELAKVIAQGKASLDSCQILKALKNKKKIKV